MHYEIVEKCVIREVVFLPGRIVIEGDWPHEEFEKWIAAGKIKQHDDAPQPPPPAHA